MRAYMAAAAGNPEAGEELTSGPFPPTEEQVRQAASDMEQLMRTALGHHYICKCTGLSPQEVADSYRALLSEMIVADFFVPFYVDDEGRLQDRDPSQVLTRSEQRMRQRLHHRYPNSQN